MFDIKHQPELYLVDVDINHQTSTILRCRKKVCYFAYAYSYKHTEPPNQNYEFIVRKCLIFNLNIKQFFPKLYHLL